MALPDLPGVPKTLDRGIRSLLEGLREHVRELRGFGGDSSERAITIRDVTGGGGTTIILPGGGGGGGSYTPDLTPPPTPTGVHVGAGIDFLGYTTDAPTFTEGNGYARTRVYGAKWPTVDPTGPTFSSAVLIDEFVGQVGSTPTDPATRWCIWLKWVTRDGVESVNPATDGSSPNGFVVTTGQDPSLLLQVLSGQITQTQLFAALGSRIDLIDASSAVAGSVNKRIADGDSATFSQVLAAVAASTGNLLANNSFESDADANGLADGWAIPTAEDSPVASRQPGRISGYSQRVAWTGTNTSYKGLTQSSVSNAAWGVRGSWQPAKTYVVSFYARADSAKAVGCSMYWPVQAPTSTTAISNPNLSTEWQRYAFRIAWGGSVETNGRCRFGCANAAAIAGWLEFDDVQVEEGANLSAYTPGSELYAVIETEATTRASQTGDLYAQYTVKLDVGGKVSGFGLASTGPTGAGSTFAIRADRFYVAAPSGVTGVSDVIPFAVQATPYLSPAGELLPAGVYIDAAYIRNLDANLGRFQNAFITNAMIVSLSATRITSGVVTVGNYIQSSDYIANTQGWRLVSGGVCQFPAAYILGQMTAAQVNTNGLIVRDNSGNPIIGAGNALSLAYAAAGTLNSNIAIDGNGDITGIGAGAGSSVANNLTQAGITRIPHPLGGTYSFTGGAATGALWIVLPVGWNSTMVRFDVEVYEYDSGSVQTYTVGGYNYAGGYWVNCFVTYNGTPARTRRVCWGIDGPTGRPMIGIGTFAGTWSYPQAKISNVVLGFSGASDASWQSAFAVTIENARSYTEQQSNGSPTAGGAMAGVDQVNSGNVASLVSTSAGLHNNQISLTVAANGTLSVSGGPSVSGGVTLAGLGGKAMAFLDYITAAAASTYIEAAAITLAHIKVASITTLGALSSFLGQVEIAVGGYLRSGQTAWSTGSGFWLGWIGSGPGEPGFSIGSTASYLRYKPSTGLELKLDTFAATFDSGNYAVSYTGNGSRHLGNLTATANGGTAPYTYSWNVQSGADTSSPSPDKFTATRGSIVDDSKFDLFINSAGAVGSQVTQYVTQTCTISDANGRIAVGSVTVTVRWNGGTP